MDCFEFLGNLDDGIIDLAILDPPYNMEKADWDTFETEKHFFDFTFS